MSEETIASAPAQAPGEPPLPPPSRGASRAAERARSLFARFGVLLAFAVVVLVFSLARPSTFPTWTNAKEILANAAPEMIVALGLTVVLVMQDFDLSVGAMASLAGGFVVAQIALHGMAWGPAVALAAGLGIGAGLAKGYLVAVLRGNSFIMTLAMGTILTGIEFVFTSDITIFQPVSPAFTSIASQSNLGINNEVWFALAVAVLLWILLDATEMGRFMYAIGGNQEAARLSGIRVRTLRTVGFVIVSLTASLVGVLIVSSGGGSYTPSFGTYLLLPAYAGAFLGAACFRPGEFNIPGTVVGVALLATISTGLTFLNLQTYLINLVQGAILIVAVLMSTVATRRT
jgi:ribose transport system permease protein